MPIKRVGNQAKSLIRNLQKVDSKKIEIGHFKTDGVHSSGVPYVDLMAFWAIGGETGAIKNPRSVMGSKLRSLSDRPEFKRAMKKWFMNADKNNLSFMDDLGSFILKEYKDIFGVPFAGLMQGSPSNPSNPLLDTGELRDKASVKITNRGN